MRDIVYNDRPRHAEALRLLQLAEDASVELAIPPKLEVEIPAGPRGG
jgi:hypothetical protein